MAGYNKLVPEIIHSSIWNESSDVRVVWITMLATKDSNGYVRGDAKTLARMANVPVTSVEDALRKFQEPDPSSHTPENEGRRIAPSAGGWTVLNHEKYRELGMSDASKQYWREQKRRQKLSKTVPGSSGKVPGSVREPSASASVSASVSESVPEGVKGEGEKKEWRLPFTYYEALEAAEEIGLSEAKLNQVLDDIEEHGLSDEAMIGLMNNMTTVHFLEAWSNEMEKEGSL
jgi:hypothetical protein